ncbi:MAG: hypothetical protein AAF682_00925 [Planctomycetota bacterium]
MSLQFLLVGYFLFQEVSGLDGEGGELFGELPGLLLIVFGLSLTVLLPLLFAFGLYMTFHIAGPIYRMQVFLSDVVRGEAKEPCKIRDSDQLQELCQLVNEATAPLLRKDGDDGDGTTQLRRVS